jgi:hypothetical protein
MQQLGRPQVSKRNRYGDFSIIIYVRWYSSDPSEATTPPDDVRERALQGWRCELADPMVLALVLSGYCSSPDAHNIEYLTRLLPLGPLTPSQRCNSQQFFDQSCRGRTYREAMVHVMRIQTASVIQMTPAVPPFSKPG